MFGSFFRIISALLVVFLLENTAYTMQGASNDPRISATLSHLKNQQAAHAMNLSWVAEPYNKDRMLLTILQLQTDLYCNYVPNVPWKVVPVPGYKSGARYGNNMPLLTDIVLPTLQYLNRISKSSNPSVIEFGCGCGNFSWLIPFAIGPNGHIILNDLSGEAIEVAKKTLAGIYQKIFARCSFQYEQSNIMKQFEFFVGDCRQFTYHSQVDCVCAFNLRHFFGPESDQLFHRNIDVLLKAGGRAFTCEHSTLFINKINMDLVNQRSNAPSMQIRNWIDIKPIKFTDVYVGTEKKCEVESYVLSLIDNNKKNMNLEIVSFNEESMKRSNPMYVLYQTNIKNGITYPGFFYFESELVQYEGQSLPPCIMKVERIADDSECYTKQVARRQEEVRLPKHLIENRASNHGYVPCVIISNKGIMNYFSPAIYINAAIQSGTNLVIEDAFFIGHKGKRLITQGREPIPPYRFSHSGAIYIKK